MSNPSPFGPQPPVAPLLQVKPAPPPPPSNEPTVQWAGKVDDQLDRSMIFRFLFFLLIIPIAFTIAIWMKYWLVVIMVVVSLGLANFFDRVTKTLEQYPQIRQAGPIGKALSVTFDLHDHYLQHRPGWFIYYLLYPFLAPIVMLFSRPARMEFRIYARTFLLMISASMLELALGYFGTFPPYLGPKNAMVVAISHVLMTLILSTICVVPVTTTAFTLSLAKRSRALRTLTISSLGLCLFFSAVGFFSLTTVTSPVSTGLIGQRMLQPAFRRDFGEICEMSLLYEHQHRDAVTIPVSDQGFTELPGATERFRRVIGRIAINDEPLSFRTVAYRAQSDGPLWFGTFYRKRADRQYLLCAISPEGQVYRTWSALAPTDQQRATVGLPAGTLVNQMLDDYPNN